MHCILLDSPSTLCFISLAAISIKEGANVPNLLLEVVSVAISAVSMIASEGDGLDSATRLEADLADETSDPLQPRLSTRSLDAGFDGASFRIVHVAFEQAVFIPTPVPKQDDRVARLRIDVKVQLRQLCGKQRTLMASISASDSASFFWRASMSSSESTLKSTSYALRFSFAEPSTSKKPLSSSSTEEPSSSSYSVRSAASGLRSSEQGTERVLTFSVHHVVRLIRGYAFDVVLFHRRA